MSITTRTGDQGDTGLLFGQRVPKHHVQIEAVGACDALNVEVGSARLHSTQPRVRDLLLSVQKSLVALMGELACAQEDVERHAKSGFATISLADLGVLDMAVKELESKGLKFEGWATPGANPVSLAFERARIAARTAERRMSAVEAAGRHLRPVLLQWVNRLSDLLWLLAREAESAP